MQRRKIKVNQQKINDLIAQLFDTETDQLQFQTEIESEVAKMDIQEQNAQTNLIEIIQQQQQECPIQITQEETLKQVNNGSNNVLHKIDVDVVIENSQNNHKEQRQKVIQPSIENIYQHCVPEWTKPENRRDKNLKSPNEPGYDPSSLYIPESEWQKLTPMHKQYWEIKSKIFDAIVLFQKGNFYETFGDDAVIVNKITGYAFNFAIYCDKMQVGMPEKNIKRDIQKLIDAGYKVGIVQQVLGKQLGKMQHRELVFIYSSGTYPRMLDQDHLHNNSLMAIHMSKIEDNQIYMYSFKICIFECFSNKIQIENFDDNKYLTNFKTFYSQQLPDEIVFQPNTINQSVFNAIKCGSIKKVTYSQIKLKPFKKEQSGGAKEYSKGKFKEYLGAVENWPNALQDIMSEKEQGKFESLALCLCYLENNMLLDKILPLAQFSKFDKNQQNRQMILDSQAMEQLNIIELKDGSSKAFYSESSLFGFIDKTVTKIGRRMLRKWIQNPLVDVNAINQRLDAIEDLERFKESRSHFQHEMKQLPDFEHLCCSLYRCGELQIITHDFLEMHLHQIKHFKEVMKCMQVAEQLVMDCFTKHNEHFSSDHLRNLTTKLYPENIKQNGNDQNDFHYDSQFSTTDNSSSSNLMSAFDSAVHFQLVGAFPQISQEIDKFRNMINWQGSEGQTLPIPAKEFDSDFHIIEKKIVQIKTKLQDYLTEIQDRCLSCNRNIEYVSKKYRYEIEVPVELTANMDLAEFEASSMRKGFKRYRTDVSKELTGELEMAELELKNCLSRFFHLVLKKFTESRPVWEQLISILAELDCLCALSQVSFQKLHGENQFSRPEVLPAIIASRNAIEINKKQQHSQMCSLVMEFKDLVHPVISSISNNNNKPFIANDIDLSQHKQCVFMTGPNMSGKSTFQRSVCIAVILGQMGCYVPASKARFTAVDRIFVRMGASDKFAEGQSTFFVEMEETLNVLNFGTHNSLVVLDELGRGTSTFDGMALAFAVLKFIVLKPFLQCRTIFSTHYFLLTQEFLKQEFSNSGIHFCFMDYIIQEQQHGIEFLYKLKDGICQKSFALNIAKLAGLPLKVIQAAEAQNHEQDIEAKLFKIIEELFQAL